ncbi:MULTISPECIES: hypothetical protein [unclassified Streptomyces]|uniref:hypothetical protein n=1 Tax=unclassified Streptomyces TaxID=2593676 RepID=UPI00099DAC39|nr:hypothetical protein [Streptomyces sp. CNQ-509]
MWTIPPEHLAAALPDGLREITVRLLPTRRRRSNPRVVKRKMSSFRVKRTSITPGRSSPDPADAVTVAPHRRTAPVNPPTEARRSWDP